MAVITMKQLLEAGVHFGHQTRKWNPKMKKYIFAARNDIHIIDLQVTANLIEEAYAFVCESVKAGKSVLFVGTKKQAQEAIKEEAERCGMYYVNSRWLGGCLTNFKTMKSMPGVMFVVDPHNEDIAIAEAKKLGIKIVAITDTNCDPDQIDYVIPGNDDAIRAIKLISSVIANAVIEANQGEEALVAMTEDAAEEAEAVEPASIEEVVAAAEENA